MHATNLGCAVASLVIQVQGGMGYVEETGVARFLRDARITGINEGGRDGTGQYRLRTPGRTMIQVMISRTWRNLWS